MKRIFAATLIMAGLLSAGQLVAQDQQNPMDMAPSELARPLWKNLSYDGRALKGQSFVGAWFEDSTFSKSVLMNADFSGSLLRRIKMKASNMIGANFSGAILEDVDFSASNLTKACFIGARLVRVKFTNANISGAAFTGAYFEGGGPEMQNIAQTAEYGPKTCPR